MKIYSSTGNLVYASSLNSQEYDKNPFKRISSYTYFEYKGSLVIPISTRYDLRPNMIYGILVSEDKTLLHIPQYKKKIKVDIKAANIIRSKSIKSYSSFYKEI